MEGRLSFSSTKNGRLSVISTKENRLSISSLKSHQSDKTNESSLGKKFRQSKLGSWFGSEEKTTRAKSMLSEPTLLPEIDIGNIDLLPSLDVAPKSVISLPQFSPQESDILISIRQSFKDSTLDAFKFNDFEEEEREKIKRLNQKDYDDEADISGLESFSNMLNMINTEQLDDD
jgi:hypothetical protein